MVISSQTTLSHRRAQDLIDSFGIDHPSQICIEDIAWHLGISIRKAPLKGSLGCLVRLGDRGLIIANQDFEEAYRFTVAHEIGHFDMHGNLNSTAFCLSEDMIQGYKHKNPREDEASAFASELLMPERIFSPLLRKNKPNINFIKSLASDFQTSFTSTAIRYIDLSPYSCAIVIVENNKIKWFRVSGYFPYFFQTGVTLNKKTLAYDFLESNIQLSDMEQVDNEAWVQIPKNEDSSALINEQVISLPRLNQVMSLLWLRDNE